MSLPSIVSASATAGTAAGVTSAITAQRDGRVAADGSRIATLAEICTALYAAYCIKISIFVNKQACKDTAFFLFCQKKVTFS